MDLYATLDDIRYLAGRDPVQTALLPMYWVWLAVADVMDLLSNELACGGRCGETASQLALRSLRSLQRYTPPA